jgi:hypothetical protein
MNVEANAAASEKWEKLFEKLEEESEIDEDGSDDEGPHVLLGDFVADRYDFANELLMPRMRERLVEALQIMAGAISSLSLGNKFFITMNKQQQRSFFHSIFNLRVWQIMVGEATDDTTESPAITIYTPSLLETLPQLNKHVWRLSVTNFALTGKSDVQALSNIILAKCETLRWLWLKSIECPVDDWYNKQESNESDGFFDPLFYAASYLRVFSVSTKKRSVHSTLVSPTALRALFVEGNRFRSLSLRGLGLTDSHVLAIVDGLSTPGTHLDYLNLDSNPGISAQGYDALLNLINQANVVSLASRWDEETGFRLENKAWQGKLNLVSEMNSEYHRLEYMTNGTFTSDERRWQWLERVTNPPIPYQERREEWDAKHLNFIWYTLCQNPEMMQVSQAPTRTRKRKAM